MFKLSRVKNICKGRYSQKDQGASETSTDSNKMDQKVQNIARMDGENNRKFYNPAPEMAENLLMRTIYDCTPTIGESSFQFMPECGFIGIEDLEPHEECKIQDNIANSHSTTHFSSLDFGNQHMQQAYGKEE